MDQMTGRRRKRRLLALLRKQDFNAQLAEIRAMPPKSSISPLISFLCAGDEMVKWRSVLGIGIVVADLAETDMESARVIMRRLMWYLNDESGGIGWGVPETMGEIMARNAQLAHEFGFILESCIRPDAGYIEHPMLQRGVLWGIGRLAHARPDPIKDAASLLPPYMQSCDAMIRGLAVYAAGPLPHISTRSLLRELAHDHARLEIFQDGRLVEYTVAGLAQEALKSENGPLPAKKPS